MDAFFASLEEAGSPIFKGLPIAVGSDPKNGMGRGVVSTANYKAREYGIHSALPISQAWQLSQKAKAEGKPEVVFLEVDFERYNKASEEVFKIISALGGPASGGKKCTTVIEQASIDEFYFDLSYSAPSGRDCAVGWKKAEEVCRKIKVEIKKKLKVTCSIGIGPNKLISKISAGFKKPDGLVVIKEKEAEDFLAPLNIRKIPGIGPKTEETLNKKGIKIIKDLKKLSKAQLKEEFGKWGEDIYLKSRGIDDSPLVENREVKSIGEQITFEQDTLNFVDIGESFDNLCKSVFQRFLQSGFKTFKTIGITVRFSDFETKTTAKTLKKETKSEKDFIVEALKLLLPYLDKRKNPKKKLMRLLGVKIEKLSSQNILI
jgi:DNA polymerase IV (DinB-like DNA polymerase)